MHNTESAKHAPESEAAVPVASPRRRGAPAQVRTSGLGAGMQRLQRACSQHVELDQKLRGTILEAAAEIAVHVNAAGLTGVRLPRDYEVRYQNRELHLVKCCPEDGHVRLLATGQESLWTRLQWNVGKPSAAEVLEVARDLESGLLDEICDFVESRVAGCELTAERLNDPEAPAAAEGTGRLQLLNGAGTEADEGEEKETAPGAPARRLSA
jgi:hypothetical protein